MEIGGVEKPPGKIFLEGKKCFDLESLNAGVAFECTRSLFVILKCIILRNLATINLFTPSFTPFICLP